MYCDIHGYNDGYCPESSAFSYIYIPHLQKVNMFPSTNERGEGGGSYSVGSVRIRPS
jgi:hypothetical protein